MNRLITRRLGAVIPVWLGITLVAFALTSVTPGDPARLQFQAREGRPPTATELAAERADLSLDDPAPIRYLRWLGAAVTGDLGSSYRSGDPVLGILADRAPATFQIAVMGMTLSIALAVPLGIVSAIRRNGPADHAIRLVSLTGASMPSYWLAYLLILLVAVRWQLLPVAGQGSWRHAILPALTLGLGGAAALLRLVRTCMLDVLRQDFVQVARARGLREGRVVVGHAFRAAFAPVLTLAGLQFAGLLGGAVIVESIFAWPGVGKVLLDAITERDYPVIQGFVLFAGTTFLAINLVVDLLLSRLDPRIGAAR